ncbi:uncharacterized protein LOC128637925 [Bombina bombina]|uniref:uncharacterized protein LOC128637925 n=1 Tax=Bombina bombina TaxID=8345 RepID=UPI00235AFE78|nr:uncharacterized protein LOC128637925 [Bombina bombina]
MCSTPDGASIGRSTAEVRRALGPPPRSTISSSDIEHAFEVSEEIDCCLRVMRDLTEESSLGETQYPESQEQGISQGTSDRESLIRSAPPDPEDTAALDPSAPPAHVGHAPSAHGRADPGHELPPINDEEAVVEMFNMARQYLEDDHELHGALRLSVEQQGQILERGITVDRERLDIEREKLRIESARIDLGRERFVYERHRDSARLELERDRFIYENQRDSDRLNFDRERLELDRARAAEEQLERQHWERADEHNRVFNRQLFITSGRRGTRERSPPSLHHPKKIRVF